MGARLVSFATVQWDYVQDMFGGSSVLQGGALWAAQGLHRASLKVGQ
jgi:hypothetical protein